MATAVWNIDPSHSAIHFSVRHMVVSKTRGRFTKFSGQIAFDPDDPAKSSVQVAIDPEYVQPTPLLYCQMQVFGQYLKIGNRRRSGLAAPHLICTVLAVHTVCFTVNSSTIIGATCRLRR